MNKIWLEKRLVILILAIFIIVANADICDILYPKNDKVSCNLWDTWKHIFYLTGTLLISIMCVIKTTGKSEVIVQSLLSGLVLGILPQMIINNHQNRLEPRDFLDWIWLLISFIPGLLKHAYDARSNK